jgi:beta-lactamase superfamily II metal-dependent hydrolase
MTAMVRFLNVGWGDAHLIQLPSGAVTLIDGGDGGLGDSQDHPLDWINRNGIHHLDWMILTHIHEDHLNGLVDIAKDKKVVKAVLPYEPFTFPTVQVEQYPSVMAQRVYQMLHRYLELVDILQAQGTEIRWRHDYAAEDRSVIWAEEGFRLTHLYPWEGDPLPAYDTLLQFLANSEDIEIGTKALERFFQDSNDDSSVYRLSVEQDSTENILFGGDQLEAGWNRLAQRTSLKSQVWKVPHHGLSDGFNTRVLSWIQPECCVIPISVERSTPLHSGWDELQLQARVTFHLTGSVSKEDTKTIYKGRNISAQIG